MAITIKNLHKDLPEDQLHEAKGFTTASNNTYLKKNQDGSSEWLAEYWLEPVLGVVTGASAPPTESTGHRYILTGSSFDAGWDSPAQHEIVEFDGTSWVGIAAVDGMRVVDLSDDSVYYFNTAWNQVTDANTDTTYTISAVDSGDDAIIRLTAGGSGSGDDDVTLVAGTNITLTPSGDNITIDAAGGGGASDLDGLADVEVVAAGGTAEQYSIFLSNGLTAGGAPQHGTLSTAIANLAIGPSALGALTQGDYNVALGYRSLKNITSGGFNTSTGYNSLGNTTGSGNTAVGYNAGGTNTSGSYNTYIGGDMGGVNTGQYQIGIGWGVYAGGSNTFALGKTSKTLLHGEYGTTGNTKLGINLGNTWQTPTATLQVKGGGTTNGSTSLLIENSNDDDLLKITDDGAVTVNNAYTLPIAVTGANDYVLTAQTDGTTAWAAVAGGGGASAIDDLSDAATNATSVFLGHAPTYEGSENTAVGIGALDSLPSSSAGRWNTVIGYYAGTSLTTALSNVMIGWEAGKETTTGGSNTYVGERIATHSDAAAANTNSCFGSLAGQYLSGSRNVYIGYRSGQGTSGTRNAGAENVGIGFDALKAQTLNGYNVAVGSGAGKTITSSQQSVAIGYLAGDAVTTGWFNTSIGARTDNAATSSNQVAIGYSAVTDGANKIRIGNSSMGTANIQIDWTIDSDERIKDNITDTSLGLEFINALRPVTFTRKHPSEWDEAILEDRYKKGGANYDDEADEVIRDEFDDTSVIDGLIAQEVKATMDSLGVNFSGWSEDTKGKQGVQYSCLVVPLIKAVQELSAKVTALENS